MGKATGIEWTDHTFNPWWGCTKISPGCSHCYADTLATRYGHDIWGPKSQRRLFGDKHWREPIIWNKAAEQAGERRRVFCASMADVFEQHMLPNVESQLNIARARLWALIEDTPWLDWLLLTKRPENIREMVPVRWWHDPPKNVWYGTSAENQEYANARIPHLLKIPATVRFVSAEPLLGPVDLTDLIVDDGGPSEWHVDALSCDVDPDDDAPFYGSTINWVIAGGESGHGARPMQAAWARQLRDQCQAAGVAYFMKQWGEWLPFRRQRGADGGGEYRAADGRRIDIPVLTAHAHHIYGDDGIIRLGKKAAGHLLDGEVWQQFPPSTAEVPA